MTGPKIRRSKRAELADKQWLAMRRPGVPPVAEYLAERERLGIPTGGAALTVHCPWCGAQAFKACKVPGLDKPRRPHEARREAAEAAAP
ncbi:MAG: zinc finger domain-containing protein [Streptosporangiaceae bacterium]